jgi:ABC-type lipoprotein export system ATPase subunit
LSTHDRELADRCGRRIYMRNGTVVSQTRDTGPLIRRVIDKTVPLQRDEDRRLA